MKYKDPVTGEIKDIYVKALDNLPVGSIVEFDGSTIPDGYEEVITGKQYEEYELYNDDNGTTSDINLSKNPLEYDKVIIYGANGNYRLAECAIFPKENAYFVLQLMELSTGWSALMNIRGHLESTGIVIDTLITNNLEGTVQTSTDMKIVKILGYKEV